LTLDDLDKQFIAKARRAATKCNLSWPPSLPEAEEYRLDNIEWTDGKAGW
jgi:hypothetical protein